MKYLFLKKVSTLTASVGLGYLPTGFAFGVLATQAGLSIWLVLAMSISIFAGALQFAAISLLTSGSGIGVIAMTSVLVNLRHVVYLMPLIKYLPKSRFQKAYVVAALTDENYSVLTTVPESDRRRYMFAVSSVNHIYWVAGSLMGATLGQKVANLIPNLEFALPCLFAILAIEQYLAQRRVTPLVAAIASCLVSTVFFPRYSLIAALAISLFILTAVNNLPSTRDPNDRA